MDPALATPAIIFNAALAYHLLAIHEKNQDSLAYLHKAKKLYGLAYDAQDVKRPSILFQFAVINNIAMIDYAIDNLAPSRKIFEHMLSVMIAVRDERRALPYISHLQIFLGNMHPPSANETAAAA